VVRGFEAPELAPTINLTIEHEGRESLSPMVVLSNGLLRRVIVDILAKLHVGRRDVD
jgi:hypothetical protein